MQSQANIPELVLFTPAFGLLLDLLKRSLPTPRLAQQQGNPIRKSLPSGARKLMGNTANIFKNR